MVTFIIIRHGYSQFNKEKRYTGQLDVPLDELGVRQAEQMAEYVLKHYQIDAIYSSDLSRAMNTAKPVAEALKLPIHPERELREIYLGNWQGRLIEEVKKEEDNQRENGVYTGSNKESLDALLTRAKRIIHQIAQENEGKSILISTHGGFVNALMRHWFNESKTGQLKVPGNASISVVNYNVESESADVLLMGYEGHLHDNNS